MVPPKRPFSACGKMPLAPLTFALLGKTGILILHRLPSGTSAYLKRRHRGGVNTAAWRQVAVMISPQRAKQYRSALGLRRFGIFPTSEAFVWRGASSSEALVLHLHIVCALCFKFGSNRSQTTPENKTAEGAKDRSTQCNGFTNRFIVTKDRVCGHGNHCGTQS